MELEISSQPEEIAQLVVYRKKIQNRDVTSCAESYISIFLTPATACPFRLSDTSWKVYIMPRYRFSDVYGFICPSLLTKKFGVAWRCATYSFLAESEDASQVRPFSRVTQTHYPYISQVRSILDFFSSSKYIHILY